MLKMIKMLLCLQLLLAVFVLKAQSSPQIEIQTGRRLYSGYQVLRTFPSNNHQRAALLLLSEEVDFWSDIGPESVEVDIMVAPDTLELVNNYLNVQAIHHRVLITDVQNQIDEENSSNLPLLDQLDLDSLSAVLPENPRDKRQNVPETTGLFSLPMFDLPMFALLNPANPTTRFRRKPEDQGLRKPRKFSSTNSSPPSLNAPVSSFPNDPKPSEEGLEICSSTGMNWRSYHSFAVMNRWLDCLEANYKSKMDLITIGQSSEGRPLRVAHIHTGEDKEQAVFVDGGMHAREWVSPASVSYILHLLVETKDLDHVLNKFDVYILPLANPDGYEYSRDHDRMWRKTRSKTGVKSIFGQDCHGVDPNRNFGWRWGGHGASDNACKETYMGPHAFSEPETRAIKDFLTSGTNFQLYLTFHSYGQYILYPWGYDAVDTPDWADLQRVGSRAANVLQSKFGSIYEVGSAAKLLYPASGGSDDWAKGGAGIKYSFTVELPDTGKHGFILPARFVKGVGTEAATCFETMLDQV